MTLADLGWDEFFANDFAPYQAKGWVPARLFRESATHFTAFLEGGEEIDAVVAGKVYHDATQDSELPAVGDWVAIEMGNEQTDHVIRVRLARKTCFSRKMPGNSTQEQVIGANVDLVVVVTEPGADLNLRRMERYFMLIHRAKAQAVVLLNKADLFSREEVAAACAALQALSPETPVHGISALNGTGVKILRSYLKKGVTISIVGSSGVGKSTLVNQLYGEEWQVTSEVNDVTGKGRHTTTARELVPLKRGNLIDNPGMREIQMWTDEQTLRDAFADLDGLAQQCKFHDCRHVKGVGCAILAALENGSLESGRYQSYLRLEEEIAHLQKRAKKRQMAVERWAKRNSRVKARNLEDRIQLERDARGDWREE